MKIIITLTLALWVIQSTAQTWHWISPSTGHHRMNGISFANQSEAIAVGNNGVILYYDGVSWSQMPNAFTENLRSIHFLNPNFACAVGDNGTILHFDGLEWAQVTGPGQANLIDVCFVDQENGWAVGDEIWRYNGSAWVVDAAWQNLNTVHFYDINEGWAGGINKLYKYNGSEWLPYDELTGPNADIIIYAIEMTGPASGWLSGTSIGASNKFYEYNSSTWSLIGSGSGPCQELSFFSHDQGFAITNSGWFLMEPNVAVYKITNGLWDKVFEPALYDNFYFTGIKTTAPGEAWATDVLGFVHHGIDEVWSVSNGIATDTIHSIAFPEPPLGQVASFGMAACGINGIMRYENAGWSAEFSDSDFKFNQIKLYNPEFGFSASYKMISELSPPWNYEARIYQYNKGNWTLETQLPSDLFSPVSDIFILHGNQVWAASLNSLLHKTNGAWTVQNFRADLNIKALHFNSVSNGWLAGSVSENGTTGIIYRLQGSAWQSFYETQTGAINAFHVFDNKAFAVGDNGLIAYYDGVSWIEYNPVVSKNLYAIHINDNNTGWAAGEDGTLLHFNGTAWSVEVIPANATIFDICFPDETLGLLVGAKGTCLATQPQLPVGLRMPEKFEPHLYLSASPNPASDHITFALENTEHHRNIELRCYNLLGMQQHQTKILRGQQQATISVSTWPPGMYVVVVYSDGRPVGRGKFVVQR
jgi:hypothetical protein